MEDWVSGLERLFIPHGDGYIFHPSKWSGGKFVTKAEFEQVRAYWRRYNGRGMMVTVALVFVTMGAWLVADEMLSLPDWGYYIFQSGVVVGVCLYVFHVVRAPHRLVKGRPSVVPPRQRAEVAREARDTVSWGTLALFALVFAFQLFVGLATPDRTPGTWAWIVVSVVMLAIWAWAAVRKLMDGRS